MIHLGSISQETKGNDTAPVEEFEEIRYTECA